MAPDDTQAPDDTGASGAGRHPGNLAPVALGLGIAGLLLGVAPFYGWFFAVPLSVVAVVLGLTARGRAGESRRQATGGLVTGAVGLLVVVGWAGWFAWGQLGFGSFASQTTVQSGAAERTVVAEPHAEPPADIEVSPGAPSPSPAPRRDDEGPVGVTPGEAGDGLATGLSGRAQVTVGGRSATLELASCAMAGREGPRLHRGDGGVVLRGEGPDGRVAVARSGGVGGLVVDVETDGGPQGTFVGNVTGTSSSSGGGRLLTDRHRVAIEGRLRDLHTGEVVPVRLTATCS